MQLIWMERLKRSMDQKLTDRKHKIALYAERLDGVSPLKKLQQGYSYTEASDGKALRSVSQVAPSDLLLIHVTDGTIQAEVKEWTEYGK